MDPFDCSSFRRVLALVFAALASASLFLPAAAQGAPIVLVLGDSISSGYGLPSGAGWIVLLQRKLADERFPHRVVNASISGDTTAGGRERLPALLGQHHPAITVIELGGNDGLRGGSLEAMRDNLDAMIVEAQKAGSRVLVIGIRLPPNYGPAYTQKFASVFADVARSHKAAVVPFFFEGFGGDDAMFQGDRIHPSAAAQAKLLDNVWPALKPLVAATSKAK